MTALTPAELGDLGRLYRVATSDLAIAQRDFAGQRVTVYLNGLVARAHAVIYRSEPLQGRRFVRFYRATLPQLYRHLLPYTKLAFALFVIPALVGFLTVWRSPDLVYTYLGQNVRPLVAEVERGKLWTEIPPQERSGASAVILTNNIQVMFLTFAGGMTGGLLTLWVMLTNGLHVGALFGLLQAHGLSYGLAEFIVAHGFIELSVIFLAGGCGLFMADGLLRPGLLTRREALTRRAQLAVRLILGCVPLLVLAGLIEGFISPSSLPWPIKLAVGLVTGIILHLYWLRAGRTEPSPTQPNKETTHDLLRASTGPVR